jgi:hypothetical protein
MLVRKLRIIVWQCAGPPTPPPALAPQSTHVRVCSLAYGPSCRLCRKRLKVSRFHCAPAFSLRHLERFSSSSPFSMAPAAAAHPSPTHLSLASLSHTHHTRSPACRSLAAQPTPRSAAAARGRCLAARRGRSASLSSARALPTLTARSRRAARRSSRRRAWRARAWQWTRARRAASGRLS